MFKVKKTDEVMSVFGFNPPYTIEHTTNGREFTFETEFIDTFDKFCAGDEGVVLDKSFFNFVNGYAAYADSGVDTPKHVYLALDNYLSTIGV